MAMETQRNWAIRPDLVKRIMEMEREEAVTMAFIELYRRCGEGLYRVGQKEDGSGGWVVFIEGNYGSDTTER